jgi:hypothetical protein
MVRNIVIIILFILIITNSVWLFISEFSGPLIGLIFYTIIIYLCIYKKHFQAGIIGGIMGFLIHSFELVFYNNINLRGIEFVCFIINLVFPIALVYFSRKALRKKNEKARRNSPA